MSTATPDAPPVETPAPEATRKPQRAPAPAKADKLPEFHVLLHNDDHHDMAEVVESITVATPVNKRAAALIMLAAHFKGRAIVLTTHKELAELYRDRLRSRGLIATIEAAT